MINLAATIKELRQKQKLSQRHLATMSGISFRQIQRIEHSQSDITLKKLIYLLGRFGLELKITPVEPDWGALYSFGLPLNLSNIKIKKYGLREIENNIIRASRFLIENRRDINYDRHYDAFKALLLALKTHYPSRFSELGKKSNIDFTGSFELDKVKGRHVKLRNICLERISGYFKKCG